MPGLPEHAALILAGGRSSRLGGVPKALLMAGGRTLLETTLAAVPDARTVCVAGPPDLKPLLARRAPAALLVREEPAFGGPAAAVAAGIKALPDPPEWTLVLACDMPGVAAAVETLLRSATGSDTLLALDAQGYTQPLAGLYRTADLVSAVDGSADGTLTNMSMKGLLARVQWRGVPVPPMSTADVDTWADAKCLGVSAGDMQQETPRHGPQRSEGAGMASQQEQLEAWSSRLLKALELEGTPVDVAAVLDLAAAAAHSVVRPAAPLTTFIAGYAAGMAAGSGQASDTIAMRSAMAVAAGECSAAAEKGETE